MNKFQNQLLSDTIKAFLLFTIVIMLAAPVSAAVHPKNLVTGGASDPPAVGRAIDPATTITNGLVTLGVNPEGNLVVGDIGLTYVPTGGEALAPGCACEGWGLGDAETGAFGKAGQSFGDRNISVESFTTTADSAVSVVLINDGGDVYRVTHDYHPSSSPNLFQVDVTVENISAAPVTIRYRRAMDWDVPPTEFDELVTLITNGATNVIFSSDDGFADGNPFAGPSQILFSGEATDSGPDDHGALFDFDFGSLAAGATDTFTIFYGASANQDEALAALIGVGAEIYSLGKPNPADSAVGTDGSPNTFIFGFAGVGGTIIGGDEPIPVPSLTPWALGIMVLMLGFFGTRRMRRS